MIRPTLLIIMLGAACAIGNAQIPGTLVEHRYARLIIKTQPKLLRMNVWLSAPVNDFFTIDSDSLTIDSLEPVTYTVIVSKGILQGVETVILRPGESVVCFVNIGLRNLALTTVIGRLVESKTKEPVVNCKILSSAGAVSSTDEDGNFLFLNHPRGLSSFKILCKQDTMPSGWFVFKGDTERVMLQYYNGNSNQDDELAAYYTLDYGLIKDLGPSGSHGTINGAFPVKDRYGIEGGALGFDTSSKAEIPNAAWQHELPMSVSFWMRVEPETPSTTFILSKYLHPSGEGWSIFIENSRLCAGYFRNKFGTWSRVNIDGEIRDGKWRHYAITVDSNRLVLYVDRARIPSSPFQSPFEPTTSTAPIYMGRVASTYKEQAPFHIGFFGAIDDLIFFNRALSEQEISQLAK